MVSKTVLAAAVIIALIATGVAGYYVGQMTVAPTGPVLPDTIKIGALMCFTGFLGPMGVEIVKGVELAVDEANALGGIAGRQIELIVEDTATDPVTALEACRKLVEVDGVKVIIGPMASGEVAGIDDYVNTNHIVVITPSATSYFVAADDYVFRTVGSDVFQGVALADMITDAGYDKVAILVCNNPYGVGIEEEAIERWAGQVEVAVTVEYDITKTDFTTELGLIDAANPEAVLYVGYYTDGRIMFRQALTLGLDKYPWFCSEGIYGDALIYQDTTPLTDVAEFLRRCATGTSPVAPVGLESAEIFKQKYEAAYGTPPAMYCDTAYDATWLAILSIAHAGVYDGAEIRDSLETIGPFYLGGSGWKLFDENGDMLTQTYQIWAVQLNATSGEYHFVGTGSYWP